MDRTVSAELTNKVARVRESVRAVQKQLSLSVLTGKKLEKLGCAGGDPGQGEEFTGYS